MSTRYLLACGVLLFGAVSCAQILGDDFQIADDDSDDSDSDTSSNGSSGGSCDRCDCGGDCCVSCTECHCQAQAEACNFSQECFDLANCLDGCSEGDQVCIGNCQGAYPTGAVLAAELISCWEVYCYETCYVDSCGGGS